MSPRGWGAVALICLLACVGGAPTPQTTPIGRPPVTRQDIATPRAAGGLDADKGQQGVLPEAADATMRLRTALLAPFAAMHPAGDGRGVLIGILDSGIDPSVPGLQVTSEGKRKILDLHDLSGEGRIQLSRVTPQNDAIVLAGLRLAGASRAITLSTDGAIWAGLLAELPLGAAPAADLNGNGVVADSLMVVVVRTRSGWQLLADVGGDGTIANDNGIQEFAVAGESFGWSSNGELSPMHLVANFGEINGTPILDLLFDTSGHGTHVAGIAAGYQIGGFPSLNGVAPGAQLIGVKIANNRHGGLSVSGSMLQGLDYLIRQARTRRMPLVVNLSLGVANVLGRPARIDAILDSALAANPDVVMTVAAGNDGPGIGTIGFPGSATRVLSVGAADFGNPSMNTSQLGVARAVSSFSARGGAIAGPDILVPGEAYSTIPRFALGEEVVGGTSMAAPFAAGLVARLISANSLEPVVATQLVSALRHGAVPLPKVSAIDQGAGVASLTGAWRELTQPRVLPRIAVDVGAVTGRGAILFMPGEGSAGTTRRVVLRRLDSTAPLVLQLKSPAPWLRLPQVLTLPGDGASFTVLLDVAGMPKGTELSTTIDLVLNTAVDEVLLSIPVTVIQAANAAGITTITKSFMPSFGVKRIFFAADSGRGFQIAIARDSATANVTARLFEPSGRPFRGAVPFPVERELGYAPTVVDASDVVPGLYQLVLTGDATIPTSVSVQIVNAPVRLGATLVANDLRLVAQNMTDQAVAVRFRVGLKGAASSTTIRREDDQPIRLAYPIPSWASAVTIDTWMPESQWSRFTDMGITIEEHGGRQLGVFPMNFPFSRANLTLPELLAEDSLVVWVVPGFPESKGMGAWDLELRIRYDLRPEIGIDPGGSPFRNAPVRGAANEVFPMQPAVPATIPKGFDPVVQVVAIDADHDWWRIIRLVSPGGRNQ